MVKQAVIFGAGQTGRGYTARFLNEKGYHITFADVAGDLIEKLNVDKRFSIHFYNQDRTPFVVDDFEAYHCDDPRLLSAIRNADMIHTAVGEQNLAQVAETVAKGMDPKRNYIFMTNENGINPGRVLRQSLNENGVENIIVSQTAVFCSTINIKETRLDILSQNMDYYPYDADALDAELTFSGAEPVHDFEGFLKRKIYTYNCLAGIISFMGYLKHYDLFGEAATDPEISAVMDQLLNTLNPALADYFGIELSEQIDFSEAALEKFKDLHIIDYVVKNGRDAKRKLGATERIMAPLRIIRDFDKEGDIRILEFNAAAALCYWEELKDNGREQKLEGPIMEVFAAASGIEKDSEVAQHVYFYLQKIKEQRDDVRILDIIDLIEA